MQHDVFCKRNDEAQAPLRLQMYKVPPTNKISLRTFETIARERLELLRDVETLGLRTWKGSCEYNAAIQNSLKRFLEFTYSTDELKARTCNYYEELKKESQKDNTSHFILRLAHCRSEELRRWFIAQEVDLFKFRFKAEAEQFKNIEKFLEENNLKYTPISTEEKGEKFSKLACADYKSAVFMTDYYKVQFIEALDLVRSRKVYLEKGYAYVPRDDLVSVISNCFRTHLSHALALTTRLLPYLEEEEDERLLPRLTSLSRQYLGQGYDSKKEMPGGKITLGQIDSVSLQHADTINHPNKFVEESRRVYEAMSSGSKKQEPMASTSIALIASQGGGIKTKSVTQSSSQTSSSATNVNYDVTMDDDLDEALSGIEC